MATTEIQKLAARRLDLLGGEHQKILKSKFRDAYIEGSDFSEFDADDDFVVTNATAGTADVIDGAGGILELDSASTTADQGVQVQHKTETILPAADKDILFECRLKITDTIDKVQFFAGLSILDTSLFASGENSSTDHVGIEANATTQAAAGGRLDFVAEKGGTRGSTATVHTAVEDTFVILGFYIDGLNNTTPLIDGVAGTPIETGSTHLAVTELAATFACLSEGTNDPIVSLDWYYVVQVR
jgi:hypothetical protein